MRSSKLDDLERRALACLADGDPETAEVCARLLIEHAPGRVSGWAAFKGARKAQGRSFDLEAMKSSVPENGGATASAIERAMARRLSQRGLIFDPESRALLRPMSKVLREVTTGEALRTEPNVVRILDRGGDLVASDPVMELGGAGGKSVRVSYRTAPKFVASIQNAAVIGKGLVTTADGEFIRELQPPVTPQKFGMRQVGSALTFDPAFFLNGKLPLTQFDTPAFLMTGPTDNSFGDWIVNFAPRLALYEAAGLDCPILIRGKPPAQILPLLEALGVGLDRLVFRTVGGVSLFPKLFVPSWPTPDKNAPMAGLFDIYRRAAAPADPARPMVYLTRQGVARRPLLNEPEVCELFASRGFHIINPGMISFEEVRRLLASPACVAGPFGSALHNLVFSRNHPPSLVLLPAHLPFHLVETALWQADLGNQFAYVLGEPPPEPHDPSTGWTVSLAKVERALDRMLEFVSRGEAAEHQSRTASPHWSADEPADDRPTGFPA